VRRRSFACLALLALAVGAVAPAASAPADRLERFRTLTATRLSVAQVVDPERAEEAYREVLALLDEEIVESLASGSLFASPEFLQERLDGFAEVWGGGALKLARVGHLTVGAFSFGDVPGGGSVRIYGVARGEAQLLTTLQRDGRPSIHPLPPTASGRVQFLVAWEGAPSGRGSRALRLDLLRQHADDIALVWSTASVYPEGLIAREWRVRGGDVRIRYELHYPGWIPGCEAQTEQEDVYRLAAEPATFSRLGRRQYNPWHADFHQTVAGLFTALTGGDARVLSTLVPDAGLRQRLPPRLEREPACDAPDGGTTPVAVSVAASAAGQGPWTLTFSRRGGPWRLIDAGPVLQ
jgi:hypothetical protein